MRKQEKILIVLTSHDSLGNTGRATGAYLSEITHAPAAFAEHGMEIEFASPKGGKAPLDGVDLADAVNARFMEDVSFRKGVEQTKSLRDVDPSRYAAVYIAGGHGTMWDLPGDAHLARITQGTYEAGGVVGAVCHGVAGLVDVKLSSGKHLVEGKVLTSFTDAEEEAVGLTKIVPFLLETKLKERGAGFKGAPNFARNVVVTERLVTGQNPASAAGVGEEMAKLLRS
jgi:putative intracellular protease/amidase